MDDTGLRYLELEFLWEWFLDRRRRAAPRLRPDDGSSSGTLPPRSTRTM